MTEKERMVKIDGILNQIEDYCAKLWTQYEGMHDANYFAVRVGVESALYISGGSYVWTEGKYKKLDKPATYYETYATTFEDKDVCESNLIHRLNIGDSYFHRHVYTIIQEWPEIREKLHEEAKRVISEYEARKAKKRADEAKKDFLVDNFTI